jgi:uncharacterized membrane protein YhaH (DUF805 family)
MDVNAVVENFKHVVTQHYFDFNGRARRADFWWYVLAVLVITIVLAIIDRLIGTNILTALLSLALLLPNLGIGVRRLHDIGKSGWWIVLPLAPWLLMLISFLMFQWTLAMILGVVTLACWVLLIYWYAQPGTAGQNPYGPDPKK